MKKKNLTIPELPLIQLEQKGAYPPFNLVNEKGEPDGYDIAVMKAIDDLNPDVEFKYEATGWDGIFTALESGRIDVIASQCGKNEEREQKYLFPDIPYTETQAAIVFKKTVQIFPVM